MFCLNKRTAIVYMAVNIILYTQNHSSRFNAPKEVILSYKQQSHRTHMEYSVRSRRNDD